MFAKYLRNICEILVEYLRKVCLWWLLLTTFGGKFYLNFKNTWNAAAFCASLPSSFPTPPTPYTLASGRDGGVATPLESGAIL